MAARRAERSIIRKFANYCGYTDVEPYEVVRIISAITVEVRPMRTVQTKFPGDFHAGGFSGHYADNREGQEYDYFSDENAPTLRIRLNKNGNWMHRGMRFSMADAPHKFYDYNF